ncbi:acyl-CoA reductase [Flavihumibacter sp.]|uniref:acyl-CoA reductase n=1 Tax=Flavihumibacter sp. TaxID=1913981 RepID=UPI002FC98A36|nr:acyl-CoA reductase [Flavihumibacter sediminis]
MLNLQHRIDLLVELGKYIKADGPEWQGIKQKASLTNAWFTNEFVDISATNIANNFLSRVKLDEVASKYELPNLQKSPKTVGIVMAGNIPMVGFHDWLCVFMSGHSAMIKLSSKDNILLEHLIKKLYEWEDKVKQNTIFGELLKGCDAYLATGSDNTSRYFDYYFSKYPHIIRRNRTSAAILDGSETIEELNLLSDDINMYFGLGCRNVTKLYLPHNYDFIPLLGAMNKYLYFFEHNKYKNNYDYQLAIQLLNNKYYMTNGSILLVEASSLYSPISQLHYEHYENRELVLENLKSNPSVQCLVGHRLTPFGTAQCPGWEDYADDVNTMAFLVTL